MDGPLNQLKLVIQRISDASSNQIKVFSNNRSICLLVMMHCSWRTSMLYVTKAGLLNWYSTDLLLYGSLLSPDIRGFSTSIPFHFDLARHYECWIQCSPVYHIKFQVWLYFGGPVIHSLSQKTCYFVGKMVNMKKKKKKKPCTLFPTSARLRSHNHCQLGKCHRHCMLPFMNAIHLNASASSATALV